MPSGDILLVDDNPLMIQLMGRILDGMRPVRFATSGAMALDQVRRKLPDLILLDAEMPGMSGYDVCQTLKQDPSLAEVPVIFVTAHDQLADELRGLDLGAVDFISKPISEPLLRARVRTQLRLKELTDELKRNATTDALTQVANRRLFDEWLDREWKREVRARDPISLLLVDIDHFKRYNDRYGHRAGDDCLRRVAQALATACTRACDLVARYGGEEFAMILPSTDLAGALTVAHRAVTAVSSLAVPHEASPTAAHVTISVGIGHYAPEGGKDLAAHPSADRLVQVADEALYAAKRAGRNQAWQRALGAPEPAPCELFPLQAAS